MKPFLVLAIGIILAALYVPLPNHSKQDEARPTSIQTSFSFSFIQLLNLKTDWQHVPDPRPQPVSAEPNDALAIAPDPALKIRRYKVIGIVRSGEFSSILLERNGAFIRLETGSALDGYILTGISSSTAIFTDSESTVELSIARKRYK